MCETSDTQSKHFKRDKSMLKTAAWLLPVSLMFTLWSEALHSRSTIRQVFEGLSVLLGLACFVALIIGIWIFLFGKKTEVVTSEATGKSLAMRWEHRTFLWLIAISSGVFAISLINGSSEVIDAAASGALVGFFMGALAEFIVLLKATYRFTKTKLSSNKTFENAKTVSRRVADRSAEAVQSVSEIVRKSYTSSTHKQTSTSVKYDNLLKLKQLLDQKVLTPEEFELEKKRIMDVR